MRPAYLHVSLCAVYRETSDIHKVLGPIFGRWAPDEGQTAAAHDGRLVHSEARVIFHKTVYDEASLRQLLLSVGLVDVSLWDWRKIFVDDWKGYDDFSRAYYPHMDFEHGRLMSLNMQGVVPA